VSGSRTFDKFGWLKALHSDAALTDRDFRLAVLIGVTYTRADGSGWAVDLAALAASLPGGLSRRRLSDALRRLVARGYLVESGRSGGGRGVTARRSFDLRKPMTPASGVSAGRGLQTTPETQDSSGTGITESQDSSVRNPGRQRPKPLTRASINEPSDLGEQPPTGTSTGTPTGGAAAAHDPEPPPFCSQHPTGTRESCPPCGDHRRGHDAWQARQRHRIRVERHVRHNAIADCPDCDEFGQVDLGEAVANCRHPKLTRADRADAGITAEESA
jgi:hypothetical protein